MLAPRAERCSTVPPIKATDFGRCKNKAAAVRTARDNGTNERWNLTDTVPMRTHRHPAMFKQARETGQLLHVASRPTTDETNALRDLRH